MVSLRGSLIAVLAVAFLSSQAFAQEPRKTARIGLLTANTDASVAGQIDAFRQELRELGWIEGKTVSIEHEDADGHVDRLGALATELVGHKVDVIVTVTTPPTQAAKLATNVIPIVIAMSADPVDAGLVDSLARPGGNTTGLSLLAAESDQKTLELLMETLPGARRVAMIYDPKNRGMMLRVEAIKVAAKKLAIEFEPIAALGSRDLASELAMVAQNPPDALIVLSPIYAAYRHEVTEFATRTEVPLSFDTSGLAKEPGALLSYGADVSALFRRAAVFVDKILKGTKPSDLPVEQPTKFELVVNLRTAGKLNVRVPPSVLMRADQVIE